MFYAQIAVTVLALLCIQICVIIHDSRILNQVKNRAAKVERLDLEQQAQAGATLSPAARDARLVWKVSVTPADLTHRLEQSRQDFHYEADEAATKLWFMQVQHDPSRYYRILPREAVASGASN
jgi:heme exporter protein D